MHSSSSSLLGLHHHSLVDFDCTHTVTPVILDSQGPSGVEIPLDCGVSLLLPNVADCVQVTCPPTSSLQNVHNPIVGLQSPGIRSAGHDGCPSEQARLGWDCSDISLPKAGLAQDCAQSRHQDSTVYSQGHLDAVSSVGSEWLTPQSVPLNIPGQSWTAMNFGRYFPAVFIPPS